MGWTRSVDSWVEVYYYRLRRTLLIRQSNEFEVEIVRPRFARSVQVDIEHRGIGENETEQMPKASERARAIERL